MPLQFGCCSLVAWRGGPSLAQRLSGTDHSHPTSDARSQLLPRMQLCAYAGVCSCEVFVVLHPHFKDPGNSSASSGNRRRQLFWWGLSDTESVLTVD